MATIKISRKEFEKQVKLTKEIEDKIPLFGTPLESVGDEQIEIEVYPNRPDLLSLQGFLRSFKTFIGKEKGMRKYKINPSEKNYKVVIDSSVKDVRPFTACAIVKNLSLDDEKIKEIIDLQEKLHTTIGRNRKKVAIGIYPLEKIRLPITFKAVNPKQIKFLPLEMEREMTGEEILRKHPTGKEYAHLLEGKEKYPIFVDADDKVLSMPPIINSHETGKVTHETKEVFIECSGFHFETLSKTLNIITTALADMGGKIYAMELNYSNKKIVTPDFTMEKRKISVDEINKLIGLELKEADLEKLLPKMGFEYKSKTVTIPPWRVDVLHDVDIAEDVAIAYGYERLVPEIAEVATVAEESRESVVKRKISEILIGLGLIEISSFHLIKQNEAELMKLQNKIEVENSKTDYKILRNDLLTPALRILTENKDHEYPQEVFEIGTVFASDKEGKTETGIKESEHLSILCSPANFTKMKQILNALMSSLNFDYSLDEHSHRSLIDGRAAKIKLDKKEIGYLGEIHPETLRDWGIKMPVGVVEVELGEVFGELKK